MPPLTLSEFQNLAARTLPPPGEQKFFGPKSPNPDTFPFYERDVDLLHALLGLAGEVGELIDPVKKAMFYGKPLDVDNVREETGDLLWYIAGPLCRALRADLGEIAAANVAKLRARYPDKYTDAAAIERADKALEMLPPSSALLSGSGEPTRAGYRWRSELSSDERAAIISKYRGTYEDGYYYDEDDKAWEPIEELWEPATVSRLDSDVEATVYPHALEIVKTMLSVLSDKAEIPVELSGCVRFRVTIERV